MTFQDIALDIGYVVCYLGGVFLVLMIVWAVADRAWKFYIAIKGWAVICKAVNQYKRNQP